MKTLLIQYKDCFAWKYLELSSLERRLVEHQLPIKKGCFPFQQPPQKMIVEVTLKIKEEIKRLLNARVIKPSWYVRWILNVVYVLKKSGKLRFCIDFRNLNTVTPKDEYLMPIANLLVDWTVGHRILSFMDKHSIYN